MVDLSATAERNRIAPQPQAQKPPAAAGKPSVVEIAKLSKEARTGKARVVNLQDLDRARDISVFGSNEDLSVTPDSGGAPIPDRSERYWREQAENLKREVSDATDKKREAEIGCKEAQEQASIRISKRRSNQVLILQPPAEPRECRRARELDARFEEANRHWLEFAERARRQQVPWQWLE